MANDERLWALVHGACGAVAYGTMDWVGVNGDWRARVPVAADNFDPTELALEMVVRPGFRAAAPSVVLLFRDEAVRRVDINGGHREPGGKPRVQTHMQGAPPPGFFRWLGTSEFPQLQADASVSGEDYYRVFTAAAAVVEVNVQGVDWTDPPEGSPR